jgi:hypothetical protein
MHIPARFNGPPDSGNGGFSAGTFAVAAGARPGGPAVEVTLRSPPPLDTPLTATGGTVLGPDGALIAEVAPAEPVEQAVAPAGLELATEAARGYLGFTAHPFPTCYVCGPQRAEGDGLRIFPGPLGDGRTAAPWEAPTRVDVATMWAALDCPGGWAVLGTGRVYVLGRIAASITALPEPGSTCVVLGSRGSVDGRKAQVLSTVYDPGGERLASARATWIAVPAQNPPAAAKE